MYKIFLRIWKALSIFPRLQRFLLRRINTLFLVGVVGVIADPEGKVILFHHTYRKHYPYGLPGGWLKAGEDPALALCREVKEESDLDIKVLRPLRNYSDTERSTIEAIYLARLVGGEFRPSDEVDKEVRITMSTIPDKIKPYQREVLEAYFSSMEGKETK